MTSDCENEREDPTKSARDLVIVRERARDGPKKRVSDRVMVRESERGRVMAINSGSE